MFLKNPRLLARMLYCISHFVILPAIALSQTVPPAWEVQLRELHQVLNLTEAQVSDARRLLTAFDSQARMDHETFKDNFDAALEAYHHRMELIDQGMLSLLTEAQRPIYDAWCKHRDAQREVLALREGLALNAPQAVKLTDLQARLQTRAESDWAKSRAKAADLIKAAKKRREDRDKEIQGFLSDEQKKTFKQYIRSWEQDPLEQEMFRLREGLILTDPQSDQVWDILGKYGVIKLPEHGKGGSRRSGNRGGEEGQGSGVEEGAPPDRGRGGPPEGNQQKGPSPMEQMRERNQEIRALLDDQQKALYDQLLKEETDKMRQSGQSHGFDVGRGGRGAGGRPEGGY